MSDAVAQSVMPDDERDIKPAEWIDIPEASQRSGVPNRTLYRWIKADVWPVEVVNMGQRRVRVSLADFERWLESLRNE